MTRTMRNTLLTKPFAYNSTSTTMKYLELRKQFQPELKDQFETIRDILKTKANYTRNNALFTTLVNTGCRLSDLLSLTWNDITESREICFTEKKTLKYHSVYLNDSAMCALSNWKQETINNSPTDRIFPIALRTAQRILNDAIKGGAAK